MVEFSLDIKIMHEIDSLLHGQLAKGLGILVINDNHY